MVIALDADVHRSFVNLHVLAGAGRPGVKCPRTHGTTCRFSCRFESHVVLLLLDVVGMVHEGRHVGLFEKV